MTQTIDYFDGTEYDFLSNFHEGYPFQWHSMNDLLPGAHQSLTGEHAYQAEKAVTAADFVKVLTCPTPGLAKKAGRHIHLRADWEAGQKEKVMREVLKRKFAEGSALAAMLLETGDVMLVEGNHWHDNIWGNCICGRSSCSRPGDNLLGQMLMQRRTMLLLHEEGC